MFNVISRTSRAAIVAVALGGLEPSWGRDGSGTEWC